MQYWIVKSKEFVSRPMALPDAVTFAQRLVDASSNVVDVTIEFYAET